MSRPIIAILRGVHPFEVAEIAGTLIDAGIDIQVQYLGIAAWFLAGSLAMAIGLHRARGLLTAAP